MNLVFKIPKALNQRLNAMSRATGQSKSALMEQALQAYLEDQEDLQAAEKELLALRSGQSTTTALENIRI